jgi:hypothetical protein
MSHANLLVGHHHLKQEGIPLIAKDVWKKFLLLQIINNKQVSINGLTIQIGKLQYANIIHKIRNTNKDITKSSSVIHNYLKLDVVSFQLGKLIITCKMLTH